MNIEKYKPISLSFMVDGKKFHFVFTPEASDEWTGFSSDGYVFDVHYDEDYGHVVVYHVKDVLAPTSGEVVFKIDLQSWGV